jgi:glycosyltransferase involved in cell wall biosynthesis
MAHLTIIMPVHNERDHVEEAVARVLSAPCPVARELILIDDASHDGSSEVLQQLAASHADHEAGVRLITRSGQGGKGRAVRDGIAVATGDWIVVQDADLEYDPADLATLVQPLIDDRADVVYGSRFRRERHQVHRTMHFLINRALTALSNVFSGIYLTDMETCYKLIRSDLLKAMRLRSDRFGFEVEITAYVAKAQVRVLELPISYFPRTRLAGKKIGWRDGVAALWHIVRFNRLTSRTAAMPDLPERFRPS